MPSYRTFADLGCPAHDPLRLAKRKTIRPQELARESCIAASTKLAPVLRSAVKEYASRVGIALNQKYDVEIISGGMSLAASIGSLMLLPHYVTNMLVVVDLPPVGRRASAGGGKSAKSPNFSWLQDYDR